MLILVLKRIEKKMNGKYLNFYNLIYKNKLGQEKIYEMISRDSDINTEKDLELFSKIKPNAVLSIKYPPNLQEILDKQLKKYQDLILSYRVILNNTSQTSCVDITDVHIISSDYTEKFALFCRTNIQANPEILNSELAELFK